MRTKQIIEIEKSQTADTRTCDFKNVSVDTLAHSSMQHIRDVNGVCKMDCVACDKKCEEHSARAKRAAGEAA